MTLVFTQTDTEAWNQSEFGRSLDYLRETQPDLKAKVNVIIGGRIRAEECLASRGTAHYYVCGPQRMNTSFFDNLVKLGVQEECIRVEDFKLCRRLMELGIPLHVDWSINCAHLGVGFW